MNGKSQALCLPYIWCSVNWNYYYNFKPYRKISGLFFLGTLIYKFSLNHNAAAMSVWVQICGNERHLVNQVLKQMLWGIRNYSKVTQSLFNNLSLYIYISIEWVWKKAIWCSTLNKYHSEWFIRTEKMSKLQKQLQKI